jgi:hypothetical protein
MHNTGFCAGDIVQRPQQTIEIAHVFKYETCNEAVLASDYDALHDFRQLMEDLLDRAKFSRQRLYGQDSLEWKSQSAGVQAHTESFDDTNVLKSEDPVADGGRGKADIRGNGPQAPTTIICQKVNDLAIDVVQGCSAHVSHIGLIDLRSRQNLWDLPSTSMGQADLHHL